MKNCYLSVVLSLYCLAWAPNSIAQTTIYVAPAPKSIYEIKREEDDRRLLYMQMLTEQKEKQLQRTKEDIAELARAAMIRADQVKRMYTSFGKYPANVPDGWHMVMITNNIDFCDARKVFVEQGRIKQYVIDNWEPRRVTFSNAVQNAKGTIKLMGVNGQDSDYVDVYFLDYLLDPTTRPGEPMKPGAFGFYITQKKAGQIDVYVDNDYIGRITQFFEKTTPVCGQDGMVSTIFKPGVHQYRATNGKQTWSGTFTVTENQCSMVELKR